MEEISRSDFLGQTSFFKSGLVQLSTGRVVRKVRYIST